RAGGLVGQGLGQGLVRVIPHGHTDYIFAVLGEEFGFLGVCALLICYLSLAFWALRILDGLDQERQLVGLGLTLLLHGQVVLVVGGILRLLPFTGMTLPFVSFGSTSLAAQFWMLGTIAGWSRGGGEA
ncbi:MAG: FtsW/RodA/SpoVE family cell cycle protein, partial [Firmicutes bacterium]|nr:FtsW/RodA/SpoVE family cell cycle protein [Bacillota bacterium]